MGLRERLEAAKRARGEAAESDNVIDLDAAAAARPKEEWGRPGRCPSCGGRGYLDHIDMVDRIMYQHCTECGNKWQVRQTETVTPTT
jgi:hypothetical protein